VRAESSRAASLLLPFGLPSAVVSATVHAADCFSTGASAISQRAFGNVHTMELFVAVAASVTFLLTIGLSHGSIILALALGGLLAAPIGTWACRYAPAKPFMVGVGVLVCLLSLRTLMLYLNGA
jgi:uncharacterized membrane protein YfcA